MGVRAEAPEEGGREEQGWGEGAQEAGAEEGAV